MKKSYGIGNYLGIPFMTIALSVLIYLGHQLNIVLGIGLVVFNLIYLMIMQIPSIGNGTIEIYTLLPLFKKKITIEIVDIKKIVLHQGHRVTKIYIYSLNNEVQAFARTQMNGSDITAFVKDAQSQGIDVNTSDKLL